MTQPAQPPALTPQSAKATHSIRYPPFPTVPPGVEIVPYAVFQERGIRLYGIKDASSSEDGKDEDHSGDIEVDGWGIPTVPLMKVHDTDECKTFTRRKLAQQDSVPVDGTTTTAKTNTGKKWAKKDPLARAQERALLFAKSEWYEQWAEGEASRGTKIYDSYVLLKSGLAFFLRERTVLFMNRDLSIVDRIHGAASEFRSGRVWPRPSTGLGYLWDQVCHIDCYFTMSLENLTMALVPPLCRSSGSTPSLVSHRSSTKSRRCPRRL